jgi:hypothetical protein
MDNIKSYYNDIINNNNSLINQLNIRNSNINNLLLNLQSPNIDDLIVDEQIQQDQFKLNIKYYMLKHEEIELYNKVTSYKIANVESNDEPTITCNIGEFSNNESNKKKNNKLPTKKIK